MALVWLLEFEYFVNLTSSDVCPLLERAFDVMFIVFDGVERGLGFRPCWRARRAFCV